MQSHLRSSILLTAALSLSVLSSAQAGSVGRLFYDGISLSTDTTAVRQGVSTLTNASIFPDSPTRREQLDDFFKGFDGSWGTGLQGKENDLLDWGSYIHGYLEAPQTGSYVFYIASDDNSELWLSTDYTEGKKQRIAFESKYGDSLFTGARLSERTSVPVTLTRGSKYYFEVLHKQGAGASYVEVGWQRPDGVQELIPTLHVAQYPTDPFLGATDPNLPPTPNAYGLNSGDLPGLVTTNEGGGVLLQLDIVAAQPTTYQWLSNGVPIAGENLSYLSIPRVSYTADNATIQALVTNPFGQFASAITTLSISPDVTPPTIATVDTRGNPNRVRITFSEPVDPANAINLANYTLGVQGGAVLSVQSAVQGADQSTVDLSGAFNFQPGVNYSLTVSGIVDQASIPNALSPSPAVVAFTFSPSTGALYNFNTADTNGFALYGAAQLHASGSYDGSGYVGLTEAAGYQNGILIFTNRASVDQFRLQLKSRLGNASATAGDGFSVTLASDLPRGPFADLQKGYSPLVSPTENRFIVSFDNSPGQASSINVKWRGAVVTNLLAGLNGVPALSSADGHWANVDIQLKRGGKLTIAFDGVTILSQFATGFGGVSDAQLAIAAQTSANYETHWFDDIKVNFADGDIGPVGFSTESPLGNLTVLENRSAHFAVIPTGASPFTYQWYHDGLAVLEATSPTLDVIANASTAGNYSVIVSNEFSSATSVTALLTVLPDAVAPHLLSARGFAAGVNQVKLTFDEPVDPATATNLSSYNLGFLTLVSATLSADGTTVTLQTGILQRDQLYLFSIQGLKDASVAGNVLNTGASFLAQSGYREEVLLDQPIRYFRLDETNGVATVSSLVSFKDALTNAFATLVNTPVLGVSSLSPNQPDDSAIGFTSANSQNLTVPNGSDINITLGPWAKKTIELWFEAASVPAPGTTGLSAATALWEEGASTRGLALYLWRDPTNQDPDQAQLVFHAWNNAADGAGSPWGATPLLTTPAIFASAPIRVGQDYHVVAVLDGDSVNTSGNLILYVNGAEVGRVGGAGQLYVHNSDIQIGHGSTLLHTGENGALAYFDGVIDDLSAYNIALTPARITAHYQAGLVVPQNTTNTLSVTRVDTLGNPNQLLVTFNQPLAATATQLGNFALKNAVGTTIAIQSAALLGSDRTVQLSGAFNFQVSSNYTLTVGNVTDQSNPPRGLSSTNVTFNFSAPVGTTYDFNNGQPSGVLVFGAGGFVASGSSDGLGYLKLTDAATSQNGAVLFVDRHDVETVHLQFKARFANDGTTPADGFSVNLAADLPSATFSNPEEGYLPAGSPNADRLILAFDNYSNNTADFAPSISVKWRGVEITNILAGINGIPSLSSVDGHWARVDINLKRGGLLSLSYDGVTIFNSLVTGFETLANAQIGLGARTGAYYETHWFDDFSINYAEGEIGPVSLSASGQPQGVTTLENRLVQLSVAPSGAGPFGYQWYYKNAPLAGQTGRVLAFNASTNVTGAYYVVVSNSFSSVTSSQALVSVQTDVVPPQVLQATGLAGTLNQLRVIFDKPINSVTATNLSNYTIGQLVIQSAAISSNGLQVTLFTSQQTHSATYQLSINGVQDLAAFPNTVHTNISIQSASSYYEELLADAPVRYFRFDETNGVTANSQVSVLDTLVTAQGTYVGNPQLGVPSLVSNLPSGGAVSLSGPNSNKITFVNGSDINATVGPWVKKTVEFWFKATTLPKGGTGAAAQAFPIWVEGGANRAVDVYLYGTDAVSSAPATASLVFEAFNNVKKDGAGSPWGVTNGHPELSIHISVPVTTNQVYHVVGVLDGSTDLTGHLLFYTNGVLAGSVGGVGQIYNHTGAPRVGNNNTVVRQDGLAFNANDYFDGVLDELVLYNSALSPARVTAHYTAGQTLPLQVASKPVFGAVRQLNNQLQITWTGSARLQRATNVAGPYTDVIGASGSFLEGTTTNPAVFFRLAQ